MDSNRKIHWLLNLLPKMKKILAAIDSGIFTTAADSDFRSPLQVDHKASKT